MKYINLKAQVNGAVTIGDTQIVGNHAETASYIPGTALRGALASLWSKADMGNEQFLDFFCRGKLYFHGLFPIPGNNEGDDFLAGSKYPYRMPLSIFGCKNQAGPGLEDHGYIDAVKNPDLNRCEVEGCTAPLEQCKRPEFYYLKDHDGDCQPLPIEPKKEIQLYHAAERKFRRAKENALFSYSSICHGERFAGYISGPDQDIDEFWSRITSGTGQEIRECKLRIGRGKKRRGFLKTTMTISETPVFKHDPEPDNGWLIMMLQTPAILYDSLFRFKAPVDLKEMFPVACANFDFDFCGEFSALKTVEGWSGVHGLPRKPDAAFSPGSTFAFKVQGNNVDENALYECMTAIQNSGVGERRNEGFGRIIINSPLHVQGGY